MRFLVIEDECQVAELIRRMLEGLGNNCIVAGDAEAADRMLDRETIDAVTLDLGMPGRSGLDWLERIAGHRPDLARRTLVITGRMLEADCVERLARCGAGVLAKPFNQAALADAVRTQIGRTDPAARRGLQG
jgi:DNA-binding response OmpR family regulator